MAFADFVKLMRPVNCIMAAIAVYIGFAAASSSLTFSLPLIFAVLSALLICAGGMVINDFFDAEIDKKLHPDKPIPSGKISKSTALHFSIFLFATGILLGFLASFSNFLIGVAFSLLLVVYSGPIKKLKFLGNFIVASATAVTLFFGAALSGNFSAVFPFAAMAFLANYGRELTKDLEDLEADKGEKLSLPMILPAGGVKLLVAASYVAAIWLAYRVAPHLPYLLLVSVANLLLLGSLIFTLQNNYTQGQKFSFFAMAVALFSFFVWAYLNVKGA